jgi:phosphate transport system permease protein
MSRDKVNNQVLETSSVKGRRKRARASLFVQGEPMIWITGGGLVVSMMMIIGLLALVFFQGVTTFWPVPLVELQLESGRIHMGEVTRAEEYETVDGNMDRRRLLRTGNFDLTSEHFNWLNDADVAAEETPPWAMVVERTEWGRFYGTPVAFELEGQVAADDPEGSWALFNQYHKEVRHRWKQRRKLETRDVGVVNHELEKARLELRKAELDYGKGSARWNEEKAAYDAVEEEATTRFAAIQQQIAALNRSNERYQLVMETADGIEKRVALADIVRMYPANSISFGGKVSLYMARWVEFLVAEPREANSEGGVFPAIFGTVIMTLLMSLAVVPFGVMAALYLREYARAGVVVSIVRISINNLAGVPSIVYGVFGLGFFCYMVGASLDQLLFAAKLPNPTFGKGGVLWASLTLALLTLPVVIVATEESLAAVPNSMREGSYACGASKWQTIKRIVLPRALPGIMTGMILAMARGAGEVAPLMLVGAVKLAPELPLDGVFPYIHPERSFMHLGFHIYDLGFQSQNSEAAKPMVFTTTLLLIAIVFLLNIVAVRLRTRLRKKFESAAF